MLYYMLLYYRILWYIICLYYIISYYIVSWYTMVYYSTWYTMCYVIRLYDIYSIYYIILYYIILYYIILYHIYIWSIWGNSIKHRDTKKQGKLCPRAPEVSLCFASFPPRNTAGFVTTGTFFITLRCHQRQLEISYEWRFIAGKIHWENHLIISNMGKNHYEWRFLTGKIIYEWSSIAMFKYSRVTEELWNPSFCSAPPRPISPEAQVWRGTTWEWLLLLCKSTWLKRGSIWWMSLSWDPGGYRAW